MNIPEGWKLVPVEPTEEMRAAAEHEIERAAILNYGSAPAYEDLWNWMLAAAPTPPAQSNHELDDADIRAIALDCGFKLKQQPDGLEDLNPYVYSFAREILSTIPKAEDVEALPQRLTPPAQDEPVRRSRKWREVWYGSSPYRGSSIVDDYTNEVIAYFGGDEGTHAAARSIVYEHNNEIETVAKSNDKLRKAAEEALRLLDKLGSGPTIERLRAALEGK